MAKIPLIKKSGSVSGDGQANVDSNDLVAGETVTLSDEEADNAGASHEWTIVDSPIGVTVNLVNPTSPTPTFVVPSDAASEAGSFKVRCVVNGTYTGYLIIGLPLPNTGERIPSFREENEYNEGGNQKGWHEAETGFKRKVDERLLYKLGVNPSSSGFSAPVGAVGFRDSGGAGELWLKTGSGDTDWEEIVPGGGGGISDPYTPADGAFDVFGRVISHVNTISTGTSESFGAMNATDAVDGVQQYSPVIFIQGEGYDSGAGVSKAAKFGFQTRPVQNAGNPKGELHVLWSSNGGAYTSVAYLTGAGDLHLAGDHISPVGVRLDGTTIGTGTTEGVSLLNDDAASSGSQQYSPVLALQGQGWDSGAGASQEAKWGLQARPIEGDPLTSELHFLSSIDGGAYTSRAHFQSDGSLSLPVNSALYLDDLKKTRIQTAQTGGADPGEGDQLQFYLGNDGIALAMRPGAAWFYVDLGSVGDGANDLGYSNRRFGSLSLTTLAKVEHDSVGTGTNVGERIANTTGASPGSQQYSPVSELSGQGYDTGLASTAEAKWGMQVRPIEGDPLTSELHFLTSVDGSAYSSVAWLTDAGTLKAAGIKAAGLDTGFGLGSSISIRNGATIGIFDSSEFLFLRDIRVRSNAIGTGDTESVFVVNESDASSGNQQHSPVLALIGQGFDTGAAASQEAKWGLQVRPVEGDPLAAELVFLSSINGSAYDWRAKLIDDGSTSEFIVETTDGIRVNDPSLPGKNHFLYAQGNGIFMEGVSSASLGTSAQLIATASNSGLRLRNDLPLYPETDAAHDIGTTAAGFAAYYGSTAGVGTGTTEGARFENKTDAASGAQQYSPTVAIIGQGWDSSAGASKEVKFGLQARPIEQLGDPNGHLSILSSINGGSYSEVAYFDETGDLWLGGSSLDTGSVNMYLLTNGVQRVHIDDTLTTFQQAVEVNGDITATGDVNVGSRLKIPTGSASSPALFFDGDSNTGIFQDSTNDNALAIASAGSRIADFGGQSHGGVNFYDGPVFFDGTSSMGIKNITFVGSDYTADGDDFLISVYGDGHTITLPDPGTHADKIIIVRSEGGSNQSHTVDSVSGSVLGGGALNSSYEVIAYLAGGVNWRAIWHSFGS